MPKKWIEMKFRLQLFRILLVLMLLPVIFGSCKRTVLDKYPSGKPRMEQTFKGKKLDGAFRLWYESGVMQQQAQYKNDKLEGMLTRWFANGVKEAEEQFVAGMKNGKASYWDTDGNLIEEKNFRNDTLHGVYRYWFASGLPRIEGEYSEGFYHGKWSYFNEKGVKVGEGQFERGTGVLTGYDPRGWRNRIVSYKGNMKDGEEIVYSEKGEVVERMIFKDDKMLKSSNVK